MPSIDQTRKRSRPCVVAVSMKSQDQSGSNRRETACSNLFASVVVFGRDRRLWVELGPSMIRRQSASTGHSP